jgi:hypothetical protein
MIENLIVKIVLLVHIQMLLQRPRARIVVLVNFKMVKDRFLAIIVLLVSTMI